MYAIEYFNGCGNCYFSRFGFLGMEEYVTKSQPHKIMKFETKKEASTFAKQMLRGTHKVVTIK